MAKANRIKYLHISLLMIGIAGQTGTLARRVAQLEQQLRLADLHGGPWSYYRRVGASAHR